jgi:hypothetical protein
MDFLLTIFGVALIWIVANLILAFFLVPYQWHGDKAKCAYLLSVIITPFLAVPVIAMMWS